jgi:hypothetical protein
MKDNGILVDSITTEGRFERTAMTDGGVYTFTGTTQSGKIVSIKLTYGDSGSNVTICVADEYYIVVGAKLPFDTLMNISSRNTTVVCESCKEVNPLDCIAKIKAYYFEGTLRFTFLNESNTIIVSQFDADSGSGVPMNGSWTVPIPVNAKNITGNVYINIIDSKGTARFELNTDCGKLVYIWKFFQNSFHDETIDVSNYYDLCENVTYNFSASGSGIVLSVPSKGLTDNVSFGSLNAFTYNDIFHLNNINGYIKTSTPTGLPSYKVEFYSSYLPNPQIITGNLGTDNVGTWYC